MSINLESGYTLQPIRTERGQTEALILSFAKTQVQLAPLPLVLVLRAEAAALAGEIRTLLYSDVANLTAVARAVTRLDGYEGVVVDEALIESGITIDTLHGVYAVVSSKVGQPEDKDGMRQCAISLVLQQNIEAPGSTVNKVPLKIISSVASLVMFGLNLERALYPTLEAEIVDRLANIETLLAR